jgi:hypothetical protein
MILARELTLKRFRNLGNVELKNLRDLNILIGPNNCGKTNILEVFNLFSQLRLESSYSYLCSECQAFHVRRVSADRIGGTESNIAGIFVPLTERDYYLKNPPRDDDLEVTILLDGEAVNKLVPRALEKHQELRKEACGQAEDRITLRNRGGALYAVHFSPFLHPDILNEIKTVLYCPEGRLQRYKDKNFPDFLKEKALTGAKMRRLIDLLANVVDPRIHDYRHQDLIRVLDGRDLTVTIAEQGSGVRSLVCLAADILADEVCRTILIDEPELGLNPLARQELLRFLIDTATDRQVFVATQDPSFVNPVLWSDCSDKISVQFFSLQNKSFVRIDLRQNNEDPTVFAGYLPHTTSLRKIHVYVEGTSDVYIFQVWLRRFLKDYEGRLGGIIKEKGISERTAEAVFGGLYGLVDRFEIENRTGIFHLCGDFWPHLLCTVPKRPYRCIVVLDGDKRQEVPDIVKKHNESSANTSMFRFAGSLDDVASAMEKGNYHPIYCLEKDTIEEYLGLSPMPSQYDKKTDGPRAAESLEALPEEITKLFLSLLQPGTFLSA